ncbi:hypothetical protein KS4_06390 [Poriferisphaera corsica]|uniref:Peptidase C39-like domain-containing protein n=1 Tax=Poriferisphaera corsica TaxID=2528020 RepID=A0A517YQW6_9BACT|nr:hypothetical protein [Poriferisphaera corsica]QDU32605.1 hypothetical protein KS4_06390 [Poriferisphaera corsica]
MSKISLYTRSIVCYLLVACFATSLWAGETQKANKDYFKPSGQYVLDVAYSYDNGGKYIWKKSTGVPHDLIHKGEVVLKKQPEGTYCCGFTVTIAFEVAQDFGLFDEFSPKQVKRFQQEWYGSIKETAERQGAMAMSNLKIGEQVKNWKDVRPGDFSNYWRKPKGGHSVIFVDWVKEKGKIVGIKYRSSQGSTNGIGDNVEYFYGVKKDAKGKLKRGVDRDRIYFYRLYTPDDSEKIEQAKKRMARRLKEEK